MAVAGDAPVNIDALTDQWQDAIARRDAEAARAYLATWQRYQHKVEAARARMMAARHEVAGCDLKDRSEA